MSFARAVVLFLNGCAFVLAATYMLIGMTSCTKPRDASRDENSIVVALSAPPSTLDPRIATDATGTRVAGLLYSSIVRIGPELKAIPEAAESWTQDGSSSYVFKMKPNLRFSNGRAMTPEDLDFSIDTFQKVSSPYASVFSIIKSHRCEMKDGRLTLSVNLLEFSATFLNDLATLALLPKKETLELKDGELPVSSGPFSLVQQNANEIVLKAWSDHPYAPPKSSGVIFKIVRDDGTRVSKMLKGELDLAQAEFPPSKIAQLEASERLKVFKYPGLALTYLLFNFKDPSLKQKEVRQAIAFAIDRPSIIKFKMDGLASLATSLVTPSNPFFDSSLKPIEYSGAKAKALLAKLNLPELVLKTSSTPSAVENGRVIANDLATAGLKIKHQSYEWGTFFGDVQAGRFQMAMMRWTGTIDPDLYRKAYHSRETPPLGRNRGSYSNADVDRWTDEGLKTPDVGQRKSIYQKVQKKVFEDLPFVPLWYDTEVAVVSRRLEGYEPPPDGSFWNLVYVKKNGPK